MNYEKWKDNLEKMLRETGNIIISNMTTVNIFSVENYDLFIKYLITLRKKYPTKHLKMQFMTNYLRYPEFLSLPILDRDTKSEFEYKIRNLIDDLTINYKDYVNFAEIDQLNRLVDYMNELITEKNKLKLLKKDFFSYINEYDKRRNVNFLNTFPSLNQFYKLCQEI
jgi:hypothetical protein